MMVSYDYKCPKCDIIEEFRHPPGKPLNVSCLACTVNHGYPAPQMERQFPAPSVRVQGGTPKFHNTRDIRKTRKGYVQGGLDG